MQSGLPNVLNGFEIILLGLLCMLFVLWLFACIWGPVRVKPREKFPNVLVVDFFSARALSSAVLGALNTAWNVQETMNHLPEVVIVMHHHFY